MGILYKLMKHRNLNMDLNKPLNSRNMKSDRNRLITIDGDIIEGPLPPSAYSTEDDLSANVDSDMDKHFTADHIIQLCKFLAEKSKRNKKMHKLQQSPKRLTKSKQSQFTFQTMEYNDNDVEIDFNQNGALPLLSKQRLEMQSKNFTHDEKDKDNDFEPQHTSLVLSTRLSADINSLNMSSNAATTITCALQHRHEEQQQHQHINTYLRQRHQQQQPQPAHAQGKRDILLKIRRQIFERKRLRENGAFHPPVYNNSQVWRPW